MNNNLPKKSILKRHILLNSIYYFLLLHFPLHETSWLNIIINLIYLNPFEKFFPIFLVQNGKLFILFSLAFLIKLKR